MKNKRLTLKKKNLIIIFFIGIILLFFLSEKSYSQVKVNSDSLLKVIHQLDSLVRINLKPDSLIKAKQYSDSLAKAKKISDSLEKLVGNADSLLKVAQNWAKAKEYDSAINTCKHILIGYPNYNDVRLVLGLVYSWNKHYDEARDEFKTILKRDSTNRETTVAAIKNNLWGGKPDTANIICNKWLKYKPKDEEVMFLKVNALIDMKKNNDAITELDSILSMDKDNQKAKDLKDELRLEKAKNYIGINYNLTVYGHFAPRHLAYLEYCRLTKYGSLIGRFNVAERFGHKSFQVEVDAYPHISKKSYGYFNIGFSDSAILFAKFRVGLEYYYILPKAFEVSAGFRYLKFASDATILTFYVGKYIRQYWISARSFITPSSIGTAFTEVIQARRYFHNPKHYVGLGINFGRSPDEIDYSTNLFAIKAKAEYNFPFRTFWIFNANFSYMYEEWYPGIYRNAYIFEVGILRYF